MADFDVFFPLLLKFEGGFVDNPHDPGGATNMGITMKTFDSCCQELLGVAPTLDNLRCIDEAQAHVIYKKLYWDTIHCDQITSQDLGNILCDFYVNAGAHATRLLQTVLNDMGGNLKVDGDLGPVSLALLASLDQSEVYRRYKTGRIEYYQNLVKEDPSQGVFLHGWLNRVNAFPDV
ncbi:MAG: glycosyl hydrolase 108 family protein [Bryobacteraceae bacterium]